MKSIAAGEIYISTKAAQRVPIPKDIENLVGTPDLSLLPAPYNTTKQKAYLLHGWFPQNSRKLTKFLFGLKNISIATECGTWMGQSAITISQLMPEGGKFYAIDTWNGSPHE